MLIDAYNSSFISELLTYIIIHSMDFYGYCHTLCCLCWPAASCAKLPEAAPSHGPGYSFLYKITSKPYGRSWNITIIDITCYHIHVYTNYIILYCIISADPRRWQGERVRGAPRRYGGPAACPLATCRAYVWRFSSGFRKQR